MSRVPWQRVWISLPDIPLHRPRKLPNCYPSACRKGVGASFRWKMNWPVWPYHRGAWWGQGLSHQWPRFGLMQENLGFAAMVELCCVLVQGASRGWQLYGPGRVMQAAGAPQ